MHPQRRTYSKSFKAQVIQECSEPGASIANIALGHSLNANLVHKWIDLNPLRCIHPPNTLYRCLAQTYSSKVYGHLHLCSFIGLA